MGKSAKTETLKKMTSLLATLRLYQSDMLSSWCCFCAQTGHKSLSISCDLVIAPVSSFSLSVYLDLPSKPHWQADTPTVLVYFRTKHSRQDYGSRML